MPSASEIRAQVAWENDRRQRLSVPAFAGGFLYLLSAIVITSTLNGLPTVGPLQALAPSIAGEAHPSVSPRTGEVKFISHHAFALIAGSAVAAVAIVILTVVLLTLLAATRFRRPATWPQARIVTLVGGATVAVASIAHELVYAVETHKFAVSSDHSTHAVEQALQKGSANEIVAYVSLLAGLALVVGIIVVMLGALRVGLVPRWLGFLGMFSGLLILLPNTGETLQLIPAFWMVMLGLLFAKRWPGGDPPAWEAGEARPWPSRTQMRTGQPATVGAGVGDAAPAPIAPAGSRKRRRKRGRP